MWPFKKCEHKQIGAVDLILKVPIEPSCNNINSLKTFFIASKCKVCGKQTTGWTIHELSPEKINEVIIEEF